MGVQGEGLVVLAAAQVEPADEVLDLGLAGGAVARVGQAEGEFGPGLDLGAPAEALVDVGGEREDQGEVAGRAEVVAAVASAFQAVVGVLELAEADVGEGQVGEGHDFVVAVVDGVVDRQGLAGGLGGLLVSALLFVQGAEVGEGLGLGLGDAQFAFQRDGAFQVGHGLGVLAEHGQEQTDGGLAVGLGLLVAQTPGDVAALADDLDALVEVTEFPAGDAEVGEADAEQGEVLDAAGGGDRDLAEIPEVLEPSTRVELEDDVPGERDGVAVEAVAVGQGDGEEQAAVLAVEPLGGAFRVREGRQGAE